MSEFQAHLPALQVLLPLIAAPLCFLLRGDARSRIFALLVTWSCLAISLALLGDVIDGSVLIYHFGGWGTPYGSEYRVDITNAFVLVVVSGVSSVIFLAGAGRDSGRVPPGSAGDDRSPAPPPRHPLRPNRGPPSARGVR